MTTVGIIGGTGKMGKWFKKFFEKNGLKVLIAGRKTKLSCKSLVEKSDLVIFCVPIDVTVSVIKKYARCVKPGCCLSDFTSVKEEPVKAMLKNAPKGVEVVGIHPMFGPGEKTIKDQIVVLTKGRGTKWFNRLKKLFTKNKAKVVITTPEKHDKAVAVTQALLFFANIAFMKSAKGKKELQYFATPNFKLQSRIAERILSQDRELIEGILINNKESVDSIQRFVENSKKLQKIIKSGNSGKLVGYIKSAKK